MTLQLHEDLMTEQYGASEMVASRTICRRNQSQSLNLGYCDLQKTLQSWLRARKSHKRLAYSNLGPLLDIFRQHETIWSEHNDRRPMLKPTHLFAFAQEYVQRNGSRTLVA